jgi:hypothetical protein
MALDPVVQDELLQMAQLRLAQRATSSPLTREEIAAAVDRLLGAFPEWIGRASREAAIASLGSDFSTFIGMESVLVQTDTCAPWLDERREGIRWRYWERYRTWLIRRRLPQPAINAMHRVTDRILDLTGNPESSIPFNRRGMVVGDVQSGKTGNYTGLICKAADAGYKVIIVLAGMNNNLRSQTQIRLDEGFIGKISVPMGESDPRQTGVGLIDPSVVVDWATNRLERGDFNWRAMSQFGLHPGGRPVLLVVKKNVSVLNGVLEWLRVTANSNDEAGPRFAHMPLLLVDDEADNASVDTRRLKFINGAPDPEHQPTAINARIRQILGMFDQAAYVGYTATPFANIFIHPDAETGREFQDLFPRDFIVTIPTPDSYVGAARVFGLQLEHEESPSLPGLPGLIHNIDDHVPSGTLPEGRGWMPPVHRMDHQPLFEGEARPPPSLVDAVRSFALVIAGRRVRGQGREHNSMLVHVTRFQAVQRRVLEQLRELRDQLANDVRYGGDAGIEPFRKLWEADFQPVTAELSLPDCQPVAWSELEPALRTSMETIHVREINGTSADVLDYELSRKGGLNVIAVGGDKLARGLTLEGLSVSYFLRGSTMYDTLLQMGRWFGYRPGYLDLCRLWTTSEHVEWFGHIAQASEELRREFDRMETMRATPREFGLRVRSHSTLLVTSRAKMQHGTELQISFAGDISETTIFSTSSRVLENNRDAVSDLMLRLDRSAAVYRQDPVQSRGEGRTHRWRGSHFWQGAPVDLILPFLQRYSTHEDASRADTGLLARYISAQNRFGELTRWNVLLVGGEGQEQAEFGGRTVQSVLRQPKDGYGQDGQAQIIRSGERYVIRRLLAPRDEAVDLDAAAWQAAMEDTVANPVKARRSSDTQPSQPSGIFLRRWRPSTHGLLLIYPLSRVRQTDGTEHVFLDVPVAPVGIGISFPDSSNAQKVTYVVNSVYGAGDEDGDA